MEARLQIGSVGLRLWNDDDPVRKGEVEQKEEARIVAEPAHAPEEALADGVGVSVLAPACAGLVYRRLQLGSPPMKS